LLKAARRTCVTSQETISHAASKPTARAVATDPAWRLLPFDGSELLLSLALLLPLPLLPLLPLLSLLLLRMPPLLLLLLLLLAC
jgi:hypothetical protein